MMKLKHSLMGKVGRVLKKASPMILTCIGTAGVVATAVLAAKATPKALEQIEEAENLKIAENGESLTRTETVKACWQCYIPAAATGITAIGCIFGANALNKHQQASLASAYALISRSYSDYKRKVKELYGKEAHEKVMESLAAEKAKDVPITAQTTFGFGYSSLDFENANEVLRLFYDAFSERYFESTISKVLQAEYHLNRNFMLRGYSSLNEFYKFLGIDETPEGASIGWNSCNGDIYWIDFNHSRAMVDDGINREVECYIIDMMFPPDSTYLDDV